ncbi:unnamed protein product [Caenorhabditis auriculariae]|uniref:Major sperm protein n=1 Tax=Caenorhabditis auriculariae TaxID=2777116 RepID=A0A8S1GY61_9PELO|nr:unnamed protein product [Caenorhabditis auriculariae]
MESGSFEFSPDRKHPPYKSPMEKREDKELLQKYTNMKIEDKEEKKSHAIKTIEALTASALQNKLSDASVPANEMVLAIEYPDSDVETDKKTGKLPGGPFTSSQMSSLEIFYKKNRFAHDIEVKKFSDFIKENHVDVEMWLEERRKISHMKYLSSGLEDIAFDFYEEAVMIADGLRLEIPSVIDKSYFNIDNFNVMKKEKAEKLKMAPKLSLSVASGFVEVNSDGGTLKIIVRNAGFSPLVYQIKISNPNSYRVSPVQAILNDEEELTMSIERKAGPPGWDRICVEFGLVPEGVIDARAAANRTKIVGREFVRIRAIPLEELSVAK